DGPGRGAVAGPGEVDRARGAGPQPRGEMITRRARAPYPARVAPGERPQARGSPLARGNPYPRESSEFLLGYVCPRELSCGNPRITRPDDGRMNLIRNRRHQ